MGKVAGFRSILACSLFLFDCTTADHDAGVTGNGGSGTGGSGGSRAGAAGVGDPAAAACPHDAITAPAELVTAVLANTANLCSEDAGVLPCGTCSPDGTLCTAGVHRACCGQPQSRSAMAPYDEWACHCVSGVWECWVVFPGGSICPCDSGV
jgi:hypothetical protein